MRILHVLVHTGRLNGHVHAAVDLACAQAGLGYRVAVASGGGDFDDILDSNDVESIRLVQHRRLFSLVRATTGLVGLFRRERFDIVHAHMVTSALLCWPACLVFGVPLVTTVHNEFERSAVAMRVGTRVIGVSDAVARAMIRRGVPALRVRTVLNGTIGSPRHPGPSGSPAVLGSPSILFVGGLHPRKGLPDLLEAFGTVAAAIPNATLHIVGEGPSGAEYRAAAAAMPCASAIMFHGGIDDPRPWFLGADIFVLPSRADPAPLVLSEACEGGCAIVASDVGGIPEMLDGGRAGILVPPGDPKRMAAALTDLLSDPKALLEAKRRANANIPCLSLTRVAEQTLHVYRECMPLSRRGRTI